MNRREILAALIAMPLCATAELRTVYTMEDRARLGPLAIFDRNGVELKYCTRAVIEIGEVERLVRSGDSFSVVQRNGEWQVEREVVFVPAPLQVRRIAEM